jgi:PDZ domain
MMLSKLKLACWVLAGALGAGLAAYVYDGYRKIQSDKVFDQDSVRVLLESVKEPPPPRDEIVSYDNVRAHWQKLDWTGKPPVKPVEVAGPGEAPKPVAKPVAELLRVIYIQVDKDDAQASSCWVTWKDPALVKPQKKSQDARLLVGEKLPAPYDHVRVDSIEEEHVVFAFDDAAREKEPVEPPQYSGPGIVKVVDGQAVVAKKTGLIAKNLNPKPFRPLYTVQFAPNQYQIGTEDQEYIEKNFTRILSEDIRHGQHRDPSTGRYDGIELKEVKPGSMAEKLGAKSGDVIKSVNGHPVNSVQEGINYAKTHDAQYDTWEIVVENLGKTKTITYKEPGK